MTFFGALATLGGIVMVWCAYLDARDRHRNRHLRRRWDEIEKQLREDLQ
jgi:hypothetical protein